jgi:hypothetical protein
MPSAPRVTTSHSTGTRARWPTSSNSAGAAMRRHDADRQQRRRAAVAAAERRARGDIRRCLLFGALRGGRHQCQPQRAIGAQREDVYALATRRLTAFEQR